MELLCRREMEKGGREGRGGVGSGATNPLS